VATRHNQRVEESLVIRGPALIRGRRIDDARVIVSKSRVRSVESHGLGRRQRTDYVVPPGHLLAPGFIDIHVHGGAGVDAMQGPGAVHTMAAALARRGVTSFVPTAVSAPFDELANFASMADALTRRPQQGEARVLGANLEGPALAPHHRGAHDQAHLTDAGAVLRAWQTRPERWRGVRIVTIAPERPGAGELTRHLTRRGVVVSLGHSNATFAEATAAYDAGARSTTHLFNAMTGIAHHAPGLAAAALSHASAAAELIADAIHVDASLWPLIWRLLGNRLILVSDAMAAAGVGDGRYTVGGLKAIVRSGRAALEDGTLAGSTISVADAVANLCAAGMPLPRAVAAATAAPARLLRRRDIGRIARDAWADLVVLDEAGRVARVMMGGVWLNP
jgi:N-acetylglucosamine-6-phosphate deacetylase